MIWSGRGDELVAAHSKLLEILRGHEGEDVEEIVRGTYFGDIIHGEEKKLKMHGPPSQLRRRAF